MPPVGEAPEELLEAVAVDPVRVHLELRERPGPVREMQPPRLLRGEPRRHAQVRQCRLPALQRPVGAVPRLARGHEPGQVGPVVGAAAVPEVLPDEPVMPPAARVVELELDLGDPRAGRPLPGIDRAPGEQVRDTAALAVRDQRRPFGIDGEPDLRRVARDRLRGVRGADRAQGNCEHAPQRDEKTHRHGPHAMVIGQ
jgi:hypothetical protein